MIRINLLPQAKKQTRSSGTPSGGGQIWGAVYLIAVVLWGAGLATIYFVYDGTLEEQVRQNDALNGQIEALRTKSARLEEVRAALQQSQQLEEVVAELNRARTGPTRVLMELSRILSVDGGPTIDPQELERRRRDNPHAGYNRSWDVRRLWLATFEEENQNCRMTGQGRTNEDIAEFLQRLSLSELFETVTLTRTAATVDSETELSLIGFELTCRVIY